MHNTQFILIVAIYTLQSSKVRISAVLRVLENQKNFSVLSVLSILTLWFPLD